MLFETLFYITELHEKVGIILHEFRNNLILRCDLSAFQNQVYDL